MGNKALFPCIRAKPAVNSILETLKVWPACKVPFMYGYAIVPKNLGCCARSSAGDIEWRGTSVVEGALGSKTPSFLPLCLVLLFDRYEGNRVSQSAETSLVSRRPEEMGHEGYLRLSIL